MKKYYLLSFLFICAFSSSLLAQQISGYIYTEDDEPIPYANIFVQQLQTGTSADENGYYFLTIDPGEYNFVVSALGYESQTFKMFIDENIEHSVILKSSSLELQEIVVKASKKDPAYAIIQKAVENKKKFLKQVESYKTEIYIKATEEVEKLEREKKKKEEAVVEVAEFNPEDDPLAKAEEKENAKMPNINLLEMQLTLNYQYPNNIKEERTAYKKYGSKAGLFVPTFGQSDLNFYRNLLNPQTIVEAPIISPISKTAILSYKYKLIESKKENGVLVHKIKVIPRKVGNSTFKGFIYINEGIWNINRVDLELPKGGLKFYDKFNIKQTYEKIEDSLWIPTHQEFHYETKQGKKQKFKGNTLLQYKNYEKDYVFPAKFFSNEVAITTKEAYERDSTYWQAVRTEPLAEKVQQMVAYRDSIQAIYDSPEYKDSVEQAFNKVTPLEILWDGVSFRNYRKQQQWWFGSLPAFIDFEVVGGFRVNPYTSYFKKRENGQRLWTSADLSIGLRNQDVQGSLYAWYFYNPHRLSSISVDIERSFQSINPYDAYLNQLKVSNYILREGVHIRHRTELLNGLYFSTSLSFMDRSSVGDLNGKSFLNEFVDETEAVEFEPYQATISSFRLSYTPTQKFMTEPNRKVILGGKYPTFTLHHRRGWNGPFGSDVDFDQLEFVISHDLQLGTFGNSNYRIRTGKFLNTKDLRFIDLKRFAESNPFLYSSPLNTFQLLEEELTTTDFYFEVHHLHHFNGALVNNIPLVKKLKVRAVAGGGLLWLKENNFQYQEVIAGIERIFKLGPRRRMRIGVYGVFANSSNTSPTSMPKISLDIIDTWDRNWNF